MSEQEYTFRRDVLEDSIRELEAELAALKAERANLDIAFYGVNKTEEVY